MPNVEDTIDPHRFGCPPVADGHLLFLQAEQVLQPVSESRDTDLDDFPAGVIILLVLGGPRSALAMSAA